MHNSNLAPPSLDDNASVNISSTPLPTPINNLNPPFFEEVWNGPSQNENQHPNNTIQPDPQNPNHRRSLPRPLPPSKCPLLCVFYAEFDIVVGPKVCFQSPQKFMHFDVDVSYEDVHHALDEAFHAVVPTGDEKYPANERDHDNKRKGRKQTNATVDSANDADLIKQNSDEYWNWSHNPKKITIIEREALDASSQIALPGSGHNDDKQYTNVSTSNSAGSISGTEGSIGAKSTWAKDAVSSSGKLSHEQRRSSASSTVAPDESTNNATTTSALSAHSLNPSLASSRGTTSNQQTYEGDTSTVDTDSLQNSIFAATSEYIITGNELANQAITVSTHGMHILSRPMIISDTKRYERNSLLFAVGFVLRRNVDPRPYWPVLSNLSSTFRYMEVESEFLSHHRTRPQIQVVLEDILISLNSKQRDCHLLLDNANLLNLHLFRPSPPPTTPVPDWAVPILLRPEWQLQMFEWDLTINWIVPHIDGCKYVKQISASSEVDMEMVRACLRVLRHHGVLAHVDVFRYSNVYQCTPLAMFLLMGKTDRRTEEVKKLLDAAFWYCAKAKYVSKAQLIYRDRGTDKGVNSPTFKPNSPSNYVARRYYSHMNSLHSLDLSVQSSTTPLAVAITAETTGRLNVTKETSSPRSFPSRTEHMTIKEDHSIDEDTLLRAADKCVMGNRQQGTNSLYLKEIEMIKRALAQIYTLCDRSQSFGEILVGRIEKKTERSPSVDHVNEKIVDQKVANSRMAVDSTLIPLRKTSGFETVANHQQHGTNGDKIAHDAAIDWKLVLDYFDHRRLIRFGVVHGLIRRVHQYPLAHEVRQGSISSSRQESAVSHDADSDDANKYSNMDISSECYHMPTEMAAVVEAAAAATKTAMDERSKATSYSASPLLQGPPPPPLNNRDEILLNKLAQNELHQRSRNIFLEKVARAMDGTHCDDELSCMFEVPVENLIEMLKDTRRWNITSVFSCKN